MIIFKQDVLRSAFGRMPAGCSSLLWLPPGGAVLLFHEPSCCWLRVAYTNEIFICVLHICSVLWPTKSVTDSFPVAPLNSNSLYLIIGMHVKLRTFGTNGLTPSTEESLLSTLPCYQSWLRYQYHSNRRWPYLWFDLLAIAECWSIVIHYKCCRLHQAAM